jgi:hypothetical protein
MECAGICQDQPACVEAVYDGNTHTCWLMAQKGTQSDKSGFTTINNCHSAACKHPPEQHQYNQIFNKRNIDTVIKSKYRDILNIFLEYIDVVGNTSSKYITCPDNVFSIFTNIALYKL